MRYLYANPDMEQTEAAEQADRICAGFFEQLPDVQQRLLKDVQAGFDGDPAAKSKEEIISSYPGLFAIYVYRLAHLLYVEECSAYSENHDRICPWQDRN